MSQRILFVCTANVCRSPLMEATFREHVTAEAWEVRSRGVNVTATMAMCSVSARLASAQQSRQGRAREHRSTALTPLDVERAGLIVAAAREERGRIAATNGGSRSRTFTLLEAVSLGRHEPTEAETSRLHDLREQSWEPLAIHADLLHRRRGRHSPELEVKKGWRRRVDDPWDVPDVHHDRDKRHEEVLLRLTDTVRELSEQIARTTDLVAS